ncbi:hypothetical protein BDZ91DRAFT_689908 [Kalaharituber pfeilii]|nr:hypothetical protein BDZ91DRAFT_689908 [Kalaharituber pfeilii]
MARERSTSTSTSQLDIQKEPHNLNLKVVRLSRPSLNQHYPLPHPSLCPTQSPEYSVLHQQSLAYPSHPETQFILSPALTLPPAFVNAYIGESFSCLLSANNDSEVTITGVRITAEMQTPSLTQTLELIIPEDRQSIVDLRPGESMQRIAKFDLKEEGKHVLGVTVTYSSPPKRSGDAQELDMGNMRARSFKKLYQFPAQQCLIVKTKAGELPGGHAILEAQLENNGDGPISLEEVVLAPKKGWKSTSLNWDIDGEGARTTPLLRPRDVMQVAFLLKPDKSAKKEEDPQSERVVLGQLSIEWRSSCGERGYLSTGSLTAKRLRV